MNQGFLRRLFSTRAKPSFFAWQIELTTRCPLQCKMCIREGVRDWRPADMPIEHFKRLAPYFRDVENVVLEGWGEPLLYKDLIEAIRTVKAAGPHAGFITSGWGLNDDYIADLVDAGLDFIGLSLAGATATTHNAIRVNSELSDILRSIEQFNRVKADRKLETPRLHIVFLLLKDNLAEVTLLLDLAKRTGIRQVVLMNLIQITNDWQNTQKVFSYGDQDSMPVLKEAEIKARELGIDLKIPSLAPRIVDVCDEDPMRNLYISVEGEVAPCVYLYPPVSPPINRIFCDNPVSINKMTFGNIFQEPLDRIWNRASYVAFRERLGTRRKRFEVASFVAAALIGADHGFADAGGALPEPPFPCRTCHRMLGI